MAFYVQNFSCGNILKYIITSYLSIFTSFRKIAKSGYWLRHVCISAHPSVRVAQLGSHWTDFYEI
jgi:hypothetical protein